MALQHVRRLLSTAFLLGGMVSTTAAQLSAQTGTLTGRVTDAASAKPLDGAQIQVQAVGGQAFGAAAGADGVYRVVNLPTGSYSVTARILGYSPRTFSSQQVTAGSTTTLDVQMTAKTIELNQTVVTASRNYPEKALDAPASIAVISSEKIEEKPAITIADHLRATAGVDISKGGIAQSNIVTRGFNNAFSGAVLMLQDYRFAGVPSLRVNVPFLMTGTNEDVERIEVLLGPASALYGPNSGNGVIHVITKSPFSSQGTTVSLDGGERSVLRAGLRHAGTAGPKFGYKVSGEYMRGKDWEYTDLTEPAIFGSTGAPAARVGASNVRDFNLERYTGEARADVRPKEGVELISTVGMTKYATGIDLTGTSGAAQVKDWTYLNLQQRFRWDRLFAQVFFNSSNAGNDTSTSTTGTYLLRSGSPIVDKSRVLGAQLQHGLDLAAGRQTFTYGIDYILTNPRTAGTIDGPNEDHDNVTEYGAYIQSSTKPNKYSEVVLAARGDGNNVIAGKFFSPRAALIFKPTETQNIRATFNRAFSTPANFSFFLHLLNSANIGGSGYDAVALGNPPKTGFTFRSGCTGSAIDTYCMKSKYVNSGDYSAATASGALPGIIGGNSAAFIAAITPSIAGGLQQAGFPAATAAALAPGLAAKAIAGLAASRPNESQVSTRVSFLGQSAALNSSALRPISPLAASFNNTYELGYKGIIGNKFRFDVSGWRQSRGDVGTSAVLSTPNVFFGDTAQLRGYLASTLAGTLTTALQTDAGLPAANAGALAAGLGAGIGAALKGQIAPAPLGVVTFDSPNSKANEVYAVYRTVPQTIWVSGLDAALDYVVAERVTLDLQYSYSNKNVFIGTDGGNGAPYMSNSPKNRGSVGARMNSGSGGWGGELRVRYTDAFPVNSGVYASNVAFAIAPGEPGATTSIAAGGTGYGKCGVAAGTFCYDGVPTATVVDAQITKKFDLGSRRFMVSINATNLFDNKVNSFVGVPKIGRLVMTRLQYSF